MDVSGLAGAGKSHLLKQVERAVSAGQRVAILSPTDASVNDLRVHGEAQLVQGAHEAGVLSLRAILGVIARQKREVHAAGTGQIRWLTSSLKILFVQDVSWRTLRLSLVLSYRFSGLRFQRKVSPVGSEPRPHYPLVSFRALTRQKIKVRRRQSRPKQGNL
jgi:hypothetical protein